MQSGRCCGEAGKACRHRERDREESSGKKSRTGPGGIPALIPHRQRRGKQCWNPFSGRRKKRRHRTGRERPFPRELFWRLCCWQPGWPGWERFRPVSAREPRWTAAVCIPYFIRKRKPEKTEEEKQTAVCDGQEEFQEEKEMEEIEEQAEAEKTVYMGPEEKRCQGALIPLAGGRNFLLDRQVILLGKSGQYADLQLPSSAVSRLHARLVWNGETYELGDSIPETVPG